jgi:hypothetical protein
MAQSMTKIVLFIFIGALIVLVITHAAGFSTAVTAVGGQVTNIGAGLSGQGFPTYGSTAHSAGGVVLPTRAAA